MSRCGRLEEEDGMDRRGYVWSIVLAGGDGIRMRPFIRRWLGHDKPKQYCAFVGSRTMFQHTIDRATAVTPQERTVVVAGRHHQQDVWTQLEGRMVGTVLLQPKNRDTGAGVFLPLTYVLARDPDATVVIFPSDHFVYPEERFLHIVERAVWSSRLLPGQPILLAAKPDGLELEYGWIQPGAFLGWTGKYPIRAVQTFMEKPDEGLGRWAMTTGAVWNTMVLVTKGKRLWDLGRKCMPEIMTLFDRLKRAIETEDELKVLEKIYAAMAPQNFSSDLLQRVPDQFAVMEMSDIIWSDWGNPERVLHSLQRIEKQPAWEEDHVSLLDAT